MRTLQAWLHDDSDDETRRILSRRTFIQHSAKVATAGALAVAVSGGLGMQRLVAAQDESEGIGAPGRQGGEESGEGEEIDSSADQLEAVADELSDDGEGAESEGLGAPGRQGGGGGGNRRAERQAAAAAEESGNAGLPADTSVGGGQATTMPSSGTGSYFTSGSNNWVTGLGLSAVAAAGVAVFSGKRYRATETVDRSNG